MANTDYIDKVYEDIKDMYETGGLTLELFCKGLVTLAYEYISAGDLSSCVQMISECDGKYINHQMADDMAEDDKFCRVVSDLCEALDKAGLPLESIENNEEQFWIRRYSRPGIA